MKNVKLCVVVLFFAMMNLASCNAQSDVYVVGSEGFVATLWKNGVAQNLTDGTNPAGAESVYVSGNDVYIAGYEMTAQGIQVAKLWKNGVAQNLTDGNYKALATSVYVSGSDVYVAGFEENMLGYSYAKLWKNGVAQNITGGTATAQANYVYASGNDVYVVGFESKIPFIWKNGEENILSFDGRANSAYVFGNDVYIVGWEKGNNVSGDGLFRNLSMRIAKLWKNEGIEVKDEQYLTDGNSLAEATSVYVAGSDVYIAGVENLVGRLWKNGKVQNILEGMPTSVYVSGSDVYVALYGGGAKLWKNGVVQNLSGNETAFANCVFVK